MPGLTTPREDKVTGLREILSELDDAVICYSGGVDSSYLLAEAVSILGSRAVALTAVSPSLAPEEGVAAQKLAAKIGAQHILIETHELDDPRYAANPFNRCYFCKSEVYSTAVSEAARLGMSQVLDGFNKDDRNDHRPGRQAAQEHGVRSPLDEVGFTKTEIRKAARDIGLPVWDKPALACLSSRFPYGTVVTPDRLNQVATCERVLRNLGFRVCRVRYFESTARIEVNIEEIPRLQNPETHSIVRERFREAGFDEIEVDPLGYRSGSLNQKVT